MESRRNLAKEPRAFLPLCIGVLAVLVFLTFVLHHLRHSFASILISQGHDVVFVSRQLGHATPVITLGTYSHMFDARDKARQARDALDAEFGSLIRPSGEARAAVV